MDLSLLVLHSFPSGWRIVVDLIVEPDVGTRQWLSWTILWLCRTVSRGIKGARRFRIVQKVVEAGNVNKTAG